MLAQVRAARRLHRAGVATPEILAAGWRRIAGPLQRHALVVRAIPGAINLYEAARRTPDGLAKRSILREAARLVRRMHDAGFLHGDLNLTNLVLEPTEGGPLVQVVDLDRGRFRTRLGPAARARNLARLLRSYEKWLARQAPPLSGREEIYFLRCYAGGERGMVRRLVNDLSRHRRSFGPRRLAWWLRGAGSSSPRQAERPH
jgi:tRNA A-37 threonylcarbamoyl transferase component Bud32